jgi:hypothetical protein
MVCPSDRVRRLDRHANEKVASRIGRLGHVLEAAQRATTPIQGREFTQALVAPPRKLTDTIPQPETVGRSGRVTTSR